MTDPLMTWEAEPLVITRYRDMHATARLSRGAAGEVTAILECETEDGPCECLFLRYDESRQSVDVITRLDAADGYGLGCVQPIPTELLWAFEVAADSGSPQPDLLFGLMNRVNPGLGLMAAPTN